MSAMTPAEDPPPGHFVARMIGLAVIFCGVAALVDYLLLELLSDRLAELLAGYAQARATAGWFVIFVVNAGGLVALIATLPLAGRDARDRGRAIQIVLFFVCTLIVPGILFGGALFWALGILTSTLVLSAALFIERRLRGGPTERFRAPPIEDISCPACESAQVAPRASLVEVSAHYECFACGHQWDGRAAEAPRG